jgi:hypothetical protein
MGTKCQCESAVNCGHPSNHCANTTTRQVRTIYGTYLMCRLCATSLPDEYRSPVLGTTVDHDFHAHNSAQDKAAWNSLKRRSRAMATAQAREAK